MSSAFLVCERFNPLGVREGFKKKNKKMIFITLESDPPRPPTPPRK